MRSIIWKIGIGTLRLFGFVILLLAPPRPPPSAFISSHHPENAAPHLVLCKWQKRLNMLKLNRMLCSLTSCSVCQMQMQFLLRRLFFVLVLVGDETINNHTIIRSLLKTTFPTPHVQRERGEESKCL